MDNCINYRLTDFGFEYGAAEIERTHHRDGWVVLSLKTPKGELQIYVTKTGQVRIFDYHGENKEWTGTLTRSR